MPAWHSDSSHFPRQACNHPYLFDYPVLPNSDELRVDEDLVRSSGKLQLLDRYASGHPETIRTGWCLLYPIRRHTTGPNGRLLPPLIRDGHKTLIFSQMTQMLDILGDYLTLRGIDYFRLDGNIPYAERQEQVRQLGHSCKISASCLLMLLGSVNAVSRV